MRAETKMLKDLLFKVNCITEEYTSVELTMLYVLILYTELILSVKEIDLMHNQIKLTTYEYQHILKYIEKPALVYKCNYLQDLFGIPINIKNYE